MCVCLSVLYLSAIAASLRSTVRQWSKWHTWWCPRWRRSELCNLVVHFGNSYGMFRILSEWIRQEEENNTCKIAIIILSVVLVSRGKGIIINIASSAGISPTPLLSVYSGSKSFVRFFSSALQYEYKDTKIIVQVRRDRVGAFVKKPCYSLLLFPLVCDAFLCCNRAVRHSQAHVVSA